jgi:hypothetical protein
MKYFFILLLVFSTTACGQQPNSVTPKISAAEIYDLSNRTIRIFEYDGCEYLVIGAGEAQMMSHKGNCKNSIHCQK